MMQEREKRYFIRRHDRIHGPFTREELRARGVETGTQVWNEEAFDWQEARMFEDLRGIWEQPSKRMSRRIRNWFGWRRGK